jgi:hypothetical protein
MRDGPGRAQPHPRPGVEPLGRARLVAAVLLAALGVASAAVAFVGLGQAAARSVQPLRVANAPEVEQRFAFDRLAWRAVALDDVFPPVAHTIAGGSPPGGARDFTRIGVAPAASCGTAFDPGLARLLSAYPCGPVMRVDYTDATRTIVATVGVAVLGTTPTDEMDLNADTSGHHDDLRPKTVAFPGTAAAGFGDAQRVTFHVLASPNAPIVDFAAVGFSDGRPASADAGRGAIDQSGAQGAAADLSDLAGGRMEQALSDLWGRQK